MSRLTEGSVREFLATTGSAAPAPGGGSVSALAGALSAALAEMVANLTQGEKYASVAANMRSLAEEARALRESLTEGVEKDTECFTSYMEALRMPKDTEEERAARRRAMQEGLKIAAMVPLQTAETAMKIFSLSERAVRSGNPNARSDGLVSAILARSAVLGAVLNVRINLDGIADEGVRTEMREKADRLVREALARETEILHLAAISEDVG